MFSIAKQWVNPSVVQKPLGGFGKRSCQNKLISLVIASCQQRRANYRF